ncbi:MAG: glycerol kinase GlpK [Humibacillus sp.]|nr:glycerol kinase GlpK [Humibacillus sp.]MDN5778538.1 glycerol kinase GlpK [Humibacillus sp.]
MRPLSHEPVVAAIDQGTTSTRCMLFDPQGQTVALAQVEHRQIHPAPGWVEHDAAEVWRNVTLVVPMALRQGGVEVGDIVALGIANQRETSVVWDPVSGKVLAPAITWQDTRTADIVTTLVQAGHDEQIEAISGLVPRTYFAGPRLRWQLDHVTGLRDRAQAGELLFGTMESWLIWNLTGGPDGGVHVTDVTNASRTMLMDIETRQWSPRLLELLDVPASVLPRIASNAERYGTCTTLLPGVPVTAAIGDQQAALVGQTCFEVGQAKCTYGSGAFLLSNTGPTRIVSSRGLISTVAYQLGDDAPSYALEGSIAVAGSLVQWLRDSLGLIDTAPQIETLAATVPENGGCYIVPAFSGLYAPHWRDDARGIIVGLTSYITKGHLARAVLEATAWQTVEVVEALRGDTGMDLDRFVVDGGMTSNQLLMQYIADVLDQRVERPLVSESVCLGAAYLAGLTVGYWDSLAAVRDNWHRAGSWRPRMDPARRAIERAGWEEAVRRALADCS